MSVVTFFIPPSQRRIAMLATQADSAPVLLHGGSGSGKGALAKWIHSNGARAAAPLVVSNFQHPLAEQIAQAQGGTLVVNEIGEFPLGEQKLVENFLKTKTIPLNGLPMLCNVRIIATTSHSLENRAASGLFNAELLQKINVFRIEMPPLSKRADEFEDIALGLVDEITHELHKEHLRTVSPDALARLKSYEWPGNLRELRNVLRVAVISAKGSALEVTDLPEFGHDRIDFRATREQFERIYLTELLKTFDWQIDKTCRMARMDEATLRAKLDQLGIHRDSVSIT